MALAFPLTMSGLASGRSSLPSAGRSTGISSSKVTSVMRSFEADKGRSSGVTWASAIGSGMPSCRALSVLVSLALPSIIGRVSVLVLFLVFLDCWVDEVAGIGAGSGNRIAADFDRVTRSTLAIDLAISSWKDMFVRNGYLVMDSD